jgi:poly-gamma-glutamate capsule biosynthesis protein CapA/YwtB (metallophosphatase superfamily)
MSGVPLAAAAVSLVARLRVLVVLSLVACGADVLRLDVVDEAGAPLAGARVTLADTELVTNGAGSVLLPAALRPVLATVSAAGFLSEPVPLGREVDDVVEVRLLSAAGRFVLHSTGDVMMGRRYVDPEEGTPLVDPDDDGASAEALVSDIAGGLALADLVTVNLESVVGTFTDAQAHPGKRWLLSTPASALAAFDPLGVDVAGLANNHQRDWLDAGMASTLDALDARALPHVGGGLDAAAAAEPVILEQDGVRIGVLAFTSVDGDYVNDQYPRDEDPRPDSVPSDTAFTWEARAWGEPELGVPVADRRIGSAWTAIEAAEVGLDEPGRAALWTSALAVYPELQDWVARRGHGGAAPWDEASPGRIATLRGEADLVVVQLHMGYQFAAVPGSGVKEAAHAAVAAGADLVVCHHPHVLQGLEWYEGKLIAYSLGNFLFDQDFLSTFRSAFLRTVWEGNTLVEARIVPIVLDRYRPVPVVDGLARDVARLLYEASLLDAVADRGDDLGVRSVAGSAGVTGPTFHFEHGTARLSTEERAPTILELQIGADGIAALPRDGLVRRRLSGDPPANVLVGRDLLGFGTFDDEDVDADSGDVLAWTWSSSDIAVDTQHPLVGGGSLALARDHFHDDRVSARTIARVPMPLHRLYGDRNGLVPLDGAASYSVRLLARREGNPAELQVRLALYHFDDLDPTEDPVSTLLREVVLEATPGTAVETLVLDVDPSAFAPVDGLVPTAALIYVSLSPPAAGATLIRVDDLSLIEWRAAASEPGGWGALDWVRSTAGPLQLTVETLPM